MIKYAIAISLAFGMAGCGLNDSKNEKNKDKPCCKKDSVQVQTVKEKISEKSIFQLTDSFQTQEGKNFNLVKLEGKPTVIAMIFTHCTYACPRITGDLINIADSLKASAEKVNFVLISFDTKRDTPARLKVFANEMKLNKDWILLHGNDEAVRTLSVLLNVQFEKDSDGNFSHSNLVSVLDKNGIVQFQKEGLGEVHSETVKTINDLLE